MFIELHLIQNFAPSCLNRDDTNTPKDCEFGGCRRARISSQCLKRAIRKSEVFEGATSHVGQRTKRLAELLHKRLAGDGGVNAPTDADIDAVVNAFALQYAGGLDSDGVRTKVLLYIGDDELDDMVGALLAEWGVLLVEAQKAAGDGAAGKKKDDQKKLTPKMAAVVKSLVEKHKNRTHAADIALFGRMLADSPEFNIDAACQVAHAISTHRVNMEMDFYTAVDDLQPEGVTGAGMMGFVSYDSACFYRYARLDLGQLLTNLDDDANLARQATEAFLRASIAAVPTARQNGCAAHNPPSFALAVVRRDGMGWNLANAFESPVTAQSDGGWTTASIKRLDDYWGRLCDMYGTDGITAYPALLLNPNLPLERLTQRVLNLNAWVTAVMKATIKGEV